MVYDCFHLLNESEVLKIRLAELAPVVDRFVILESTKTYSGHDKPLNFDKSLLSQYPIDYQVVDDRIDAGGPWEREWRQRQRATWYVQPKPDDVVIYSDLDEIPKADAVRSFLPSMNIASFRMSHHYYYLNVRARDDWYHAKIMSGKQWNDSDLSDIRNGHSALVMNDGGWHFAYMGGMDRLIYKIQSFSHCNDANIPGLVKDYQSGIRPEIRNREEYGLRMVDIDESYPAYVRENIEQLKGTGMILEQWQ